MDSSGVPTADGLGFCESSRRMAEIHTAHSANVFGTAERQERAYTLQLSTFVGGRKRQGYL